MDEYTTKVMKRLYGRYSNQLTTALDHVNMTELFVAVLLSPQSNDNQTNRVTERLFTKYKTFEDYANADLNALRKDMSGMNYYKTKAKHLRLAARMILDRFGGEVPRTLAELMELPGVGRKVANVVQNEGYNLDEGIAVDTHAARTSRRLRLSRRKDPVKIEQDLMRRIDKTWWRNSSNLLIALGRDTCKARKKECYRCVLRDICPSSEASAGKEKGI